MNCSNCGVSNNVDAKSCISCGQSLSYVQTSVEQSVQNINNNTNIIPENQGNKNIKKIIIIIIILLAVAGCAFVGYKIFSKDKTKKENFDIKETTSFFLQNSVSKYALFNENGKQLTEFLYTRVEDFVNGYAVVEIDDQEGIINENGKMTVPLNKYKYITLKGGLYSVSEITEKSYNKYLIDGNGKILYDLDKVDVNSFTDVDTYLIIELKEENKYKVINYGGKELVSFSKVDDDEVKDPSTNEEDEYISIFYNNKNWIFNVNTGKQIAAFDSELHYCVNRVSDDKNIITLNSCGSWYESQDKTYYKFIKDGKLYDKTNECDSIKQSSGILFCNKDDKQYMLDSNLNISIETTPKAYNNKAYNNSNGYVMNNPTTFNGVDFYKNGKLVKNVSCRSLKETGYTATDVYILGTYYSRDCGTQQGEYEYYKANGEKLNDKSYKRAEKFDSNGLAKVSEDKTNYYMIDKNGKQVGNVYTNISLDRGFYIITNNDLKGIMNKEGKEIIPATYSKVNISTHNERHLATLTTPEKKYIVYDLDKNKKLFTLEAYPNMNNGNYITTSSDGKTQYYTYDGKMFYEK